METAVEWLEERLNRNGLGLTIEEIKQAKQIEQQQIINAAMWMPEPFSSIEFIPELAIQYYNDKYGNV
jgi:hypothetical protein